MKPIIPSPIDLREAQNAVDLALTSGIELVKVNFKLATHSWDASNTPRWKDRGPYTSGGSRIREYTTSDYPFLWVDEGTRPHKIYPVRAKFLRFNTGFIPKTKPKRLVATSGAYFGPETFRTQVSHPGIKAREITEQVKEVTERDWANFIQNRINYMTTL